MRIIRRRIAIACMILCALFMGCTPAYTVVGDTLSEEAVQKL